MPNNAEIESIHSAERIVLGRSVPAFTIRLKGNHTNDYAEYLLKSHPVLSGFMEVYITGYNFRYHHDIASDETVLNYSNVTYSDCPVVEMIFRVHGFEGFQKAFSLSRIARCPETAIIVDLSVENLDPHASGVLKKLADSYHDQVVAADIEYSDPLEYAQRGSSKFQVFTSILSKKHCIFLIHQTQFESFGIRIGFYSEICKLTSSLFSDRNYTDREKILKTRKWLCDNLEYVDEDSRSDHSAAIALLRRKTVCQGYAALAVAILRCAGVPVLYVGGRSCNGGGHAWNLVRLDGRWYHIDITWGRHYPEDKDPYLLLPDDQFPKHEWDHSFYTHENNEKRAEAEARLNHHVFSFTLDSRVCQVDQHDLVIPGLCPLIQNHGQKMVDLITLFQFLEIGYQREEDFLTIYTRHRSYSFPIADETFSGPCQVLERNGRLYFSVDALTQLENIALCQTDDRAMILTGAN